MMTTVGGRALAEDPVNVASNIKYDAQSAHLSPIKFERKQAQSAATKNVRDQLIQFAKIAEDDEDQETTTYFCHAFEAFQVHGAAQEVQKAIISCCFPSWSEVEQHDGNG